MNHEKHENQDAPQKLAVVSFLAGGYRCAVDAAQVRAQLPQDPDKPALPVEQLLGLEADLYGELGFHSTLLIKTGDDEVAVRVMDPVQLHELAQAAIHPLPGLIGACNQLTGLCALALVPQGLVLLVDLQLAIKSRNSHLAPALLHAENPV